MNRFALVLSTLVCLFVCLGAEGNRSVSVGVRSMVSNKHPHEPFDYYNLDFCRHRNRSEPGREVTLGSMLTGEAYKHTPYSFEFGVDVQDRVVCRMVCSEACIRRFLRFVQQGYSVRYTVGDTVALSEGVKGYAMGHPIGNPLDDSHANLNAHVEFDVFFVDGSRADRVSNKGLTQSLYDWLPWSGPVETVDGGSGDRGPLVVGFKTRSSASHVLSLDNVLKNNATHETIPWSVSVRWVEVKEGLIEADFARYLAEANRNYAGSERTTREAVQCACLLLLLSGALVFVQSRLIRKHVLKVCHVEEKDTSDLSVLFVPSKTIDLDSVGKARAPELQFKSGARSQGNESSYDSFEDDDDQDGGYDEEEEGEEDEDDDGYRSEARRNRNQRGDTYFEASFARFGSLYETVTGWMVYKDFVFKQPRTGFLLLCACVGVGAQVLGAGLCVAVTLLFFPDSAVAMPELGVFFFIGGACVAGFVASGVHLLVHEKDALSRADILRVVLYSGVAFPTVVLACASAINYCFYLNDAGTAVGWAYVPVVYALCGMSTLALAGMGYFFGIRPRRNLKPAWARVRGDRTSSLTSIDRFEQPEVKQSWGCWFAFSVVLRLVNTLLVAAPMLPILRSVYVTPSEVLLQENATLVVFVFAILEVVLVYHASRGFVYVGLIHSDFAWWWTSFSMPFQSAAWFFAYAAFHYAFESEIEGVYSATIYFVRSFLVSLSAGFGMGFVGFVSSYAFLYNIYTFSSFGKTN